MRGSEQACQSGTDAFLLIAPMPASEEQEQTLLVLATRGVNAVSI
jgi:hypothetical protein